MAEVPVTFDPSGRTAWVETGVTVLDAAKAAGVAIEATCAGRGTCGACGVRILSGEVASADELERRSLGPDSGNLRLACRARVCGPVTVRPLIRSRVTGGASGEVPPGSRLAVGVDLGTTSVVAAVVDARTGRELGRAVTANEQRSFGADVMSRISAAYAGQGPVLEQLARDSIEAAIVAALGDTTASVELVMIAANTAMGALVQGIPVDTLSTAPFTAPEPWPQALREGFRDARLQSAQSTVLPPLGAFVGGDALAGALATELLSGPGPAMLIDVGTNAEVVLASGKELIATSGPAGPAFEGAGIGCGGPATAGGIVAVRLADDGSLEIRTIEGAPARWFTGAGLVSATALLRRTGHLDATGLMSAEGPLQSRFSRDEAGVARFDFDAGVSLTQLDIRAIQLAVAAIRVAVGSVLEDAGLRGGDLRSVSVAGAFGAALDLSDLVDLGLIPSGAAGAARLAGNTALAGAIELAREAPARREESISRIVGSVRVLDLATRPGFNERLMAAMTLDATLG